MSRRGIMASREGMTLVEVLLATVILGSGLLVLMTAIGRCLRVYRVAGELQQVQWVIGKGEMKYPLYDATEPVEDLTVSEDSELVEGYTFSREVEDDEDEDGLYVVRTRVTWGSGGEGQNEEIVRYIYHKK